MELWCGDLGIATNVVAGVVAVVAMLVLVKHHYQPLQPQHHF